MKRIVTLLTAAAVLLSSCGKEEPEQTLEPAVYSGLFSIENSDGSVHTTEDVKADYTVQPDQTVDLILYGVSFSPKMPLKLDVTIPGITSETRNSVMTVSGDEIIPLAMGGPFERYIVKGLSGTIDKDRMELQMTIGGCASSYSGAVISK